MKKVFLLSIFILLVFSSCSKDDTATDSNPSSFLVGKWEYVAYIDEYDYAWTDDDSGFFVFTNDRLKVDLEDWDGEYEYEYLPESNELVFLGTVHEVEIMNNNEIVIREGCCGNQLKRVE